MLPALPLGWLDTPAPEYLAAAADCPRGRITEIVGPRSSGRCSFMHSILEASTQLGEFAVLIDTNNSFDPCSAAAAGVSGEHDLDPVIKRGRRAAYRCALSRSKDRRRSVAPRATKTRTDAGSVSMSSAGPGAPAAACRYRLPPAPAPHARSARTISSTVVRSGLLPHAGTSVNTAASLAGTPLDAAFTCSPARRKTCRHQVSVLSGISRCSPDSRSVKPLRYHRANTRRI